jgi:carbon storage regulator
VLTLTRSVGETIRIGDDIEVHVVEVRGGTVRLGFKAPREVAIHREEVYRQIAEANLLAAQVTADTLGALAAFAPQPVAPQDAPASPGTEATAPQDASASPGSEDAAPASAPEVAPAAGTGPARREGAAS